MYVHIFLNVTYVSSLFSRYDIPLWLHQPSLDLQPCQPGAYFVAPSAFAAMSGAWVMWSVNPKHSRPQQKYIDLMPISLNLAFIKPICFFLKPLRGREVTVPMNEWPYWYGSFTCIGSSPNGLALASRRFFASPPCGWVWVQGETWTSCKGTPLKLAVQISAEGWHL